MSRSLREISWQVPEETYREDPALSYSTLAKYERSGFNGLETLFDKVESPSLTFGQAVDSIITGGEEEFNQRFFVADMPETPDSVVKIVKDLFAVYGTSYNSIESIPDSNVLVVVNNNSYQQNWKPETRVKVVKEKGSRYYELLFLSGTKTILSSEVADNVYAAVRALKESEATKWYFEEDNPFDDSIQRFYQLKFKATLNGIDYRCMADELIVDKKNKIVYPIDLKTSSHKEWDFYQSFVQWRYDVQARTYWRIIRKVMDADEEFKDYKLADYKFIVVNKETLTPLVWEFESTTETGNLFFGKNKQIEMRDPETIGQELHYYLSTENVVVPQGIEINNSNSLIKWMENM